MKIKILHILYKINIGGTEKAVLNYIREQKDESIINDTCSLYNGTLSIEYKKHSNKHVEINESNLIKKYSKLKRFLKENNYDIIYTYGLRTNILLRLMPKNFKLIYGIRGIGNSNNKIVEVLNKLTLKRNDLIITNSKTNKKFILKKYNLKKDEIIAIHNGTYLSKEISELSFTDELNLVTIANLRKVKGFEYLLPAIKQLKDEGINVNLKILGEGPEREMIETYIKDNYLTKNIQLYGQVEDVYKFLNNSHILISASLSEGLSNSIMEGMASGLPIIATDVGGSSELVTSNKSGILINPQDINSLVNAIKVYYERPYLMKINGLNGRKKIEKEFSFENLIKNNNKIFKKLKE